MFEALAVAALTLAQPDNLLLVVLGSVIGLVFGVLPGLTSLTAIAILLPFTYGLEPMSAMFLLSGVMGAARFGGAITAILLNIPGTPVNAASTFDGHPMAQQGEASRALAIAATASGLGAVVGLVVLVVLIPVFREIVLAFGPPEIFMLTMLALTTASFAAPGNMLKGLISGGIGIMIALIGFSQVTGILRFDFGSEYYMWDGVPLIPFFVGIFAISEVISLIVKGKSISRSRERGSDSIQGIAKGIRDVFVHWRCLFRSSMIGTFIGILPGVGGTVANLISYATALQLSPNKSSFGKGNPEGLIASEAANNAEQGGALLPTVVFGIPGAAEMALLLGAFILQGFVPGPFFLLEHLDVVCSLILGFLASNIVASVAGLFAARWLAMVTTLSSGILVTVILPVALVGAYVARENLWDVMLAVLAGLFGYGLIRFKFPIVTMVLGFILGVLAERAFIQSLQLSFGDYWVFFTRPVSATLFVALVAVLVLPAIRRKYLKE